MKVADVMTKNVRLISPDQTLREAAHLMSEEGIGVVPVADHDHLVGMVTDRDIAIRGVALGKKGPGAKVKEVMSEQVKYRFEDEDLDHVSKNMASIQMRRLPVMNRDKRLVGIVSLGDLAVTNKSQHAGRTGIARGFPTVVTMSGAPWSHLDRPAASAQPPARSGGCPSPLAALDHDQRCNHRQRARPHLALGKTQFRFG